MQIAKTGICGSDVHYLKEAKIGNYVLDKPMGLGHESSGVLVKVGSAASARGFVVEDRVALEPGMSCKSCEFCLSGKYHVSICFNFRDAFSDLWLTGVSSARTWSSLRPRRMPMGRYVGTVRPYLPLCRHEGASADMSSDALTADMVHILPDSVSLEDGAMIEPLAVATHAVSTLGQCKSDQVVFVFGAGPVGLLSMAVAKALGARRVVAVDINPDRLEFAKTHYATDSFLPVRLDA